MLFPGGGGAAAARRRGRAEPAPNADHGHRDAASAGPPLSGVLVEQSDFFVTLRRPTARVRAVRKDARARRSSTTNPLQAHIDLLDVITDKQIHDLVAYLETLK